MRFKPLKNLTLGKSKEKPEKEDDEPKEIASDRITDMEKQINVKTKDLEEKAQQIQDLSPQSEEQESNGDTSKGPHGPLKELNVEEENKPDDVMSLADMSDEDDDSEMDGEEIKLVEVHAARVQSQEKEGEAAPVKVTQIEASATSEKPDETEKETKPEGDEGGDSLNNLFSEEEVEENPLANLIKSMPDVTAGELIDDLKEIRGIIKEWQKK